MRIGVPNKRRRGGGSSKGQALSSKSINGLSQGHGT